MLNGGEATRLMEAAKTFRPRILAQREGIEAGRRLPEDLVRELAHAGFFRISLVSGCQLATCHAVTSACQAVDLVYLTGGATSLYASCPIERAFRDVHAITQHIGVHPRILETTGRVLFGLEPDIPLSML